MLAALCVCLLLASASGEPQQLNGNYLPPNKCPPAKTITSYSDRLVVSTQTRVVSRPEVRYVTRTVVSSRVVPSVIVRTSVYRSTVVVPQEVVRTSNVVRYVTRTVTVPGGVREVVRTREEVVRSTDFQQVYTTLERTQTSTSIQYRTQTNTVVVTRTQFVPQISVYTQRQTVPGPNVVRTQTQEVLRTRVVTQPPQQVVSTYVQEEVRYQTIPVPVPGAVRTSTVVQRSRQVIPVQSEVVVPQEKVVYVSSTRQYEQTLYQTYTSQKVVPVQVTSTKLVNSRILKTRQIQATSTKVLVKTDYVTITDPGREIVSVVKSTHINFVTQPGKVIPVVKTQEVEKIVNREIVSTRVVPKAVVRTEYVDLPCKGYGGGKGGVKAPSREYGAPLPSAVYGAPVARKVPSRGYGVPLKIPSRGYGPPLVGTGSNYGRYVSYGIPFY